MRRIPYSIARGEIAGRSMHGVLTPRFFKHVLINERGPRATAAHIQAGLCSDLMNRCATAIVEIHVQPKFVLWPRENLTAQEDERPRNQERLGSAWESRAARSLPSVD